MASVLTLSVAMMLGFPHLGFISKHRWRRTPRTKAIRLCTIPGGRAEWLGSSLLANRSLDLLWIDVAGVPLDVDKVRYGARVGDRIRRRAEGHWGGDHSVFFFE